MVSSRLDLCSCGGCGVIGLVSYERFGKVSNSNCMCSSMGYPYTELDSKKCMVLNLTSCPLVPTIRLVVE